MELARWLVRSGRCERCAFVSLETYAHDRAVLDSLGRQLVGEHYSVVEYGKDLAEAMQPLQRVLENETCLLLLDNLESLLADPTNLRPELDLLQALTAGDEKTRLLFTSREPLPEPFDLELLRVELGELNDADARELILKVMAEQGLELRHDDQGRPPEAVNALVEAVHGHARALVLLAGELSRAGLESTTANIRRIMAELDKKHPGERENSLYASVELSLQRLPETVREGIGGLAVFHDGGTTQDIAHVLEIEIEEAFKLGGALIQVGLATDMGDSYLRLDPALPGHLGAQLTEEETERYRARWFEIIGQLLGFLYQQRFKDTRLAARLTRLELPNLMAWLRAARQGLRDGQLDAASLSDRTGSLEQLLANLDRPQALAEAVAVREEAAAGLGEWSNARFVSERLGIERLLAQGALQAAHDKARALLQQAQLAGPAAYAGADFDLAMANEMLGQVMSTGGVAAEALPYLERAQQGFEALGEAGARMASACLTRQGDCLQALGQLEQAAEAYEEGIKRFEEQNDLRSVAAAKGQLATVRMYQKNYAAALQGYQEVLELFEQMGEPSSVAGTWHLIGMVYREQGAFDRAESAYRQSLAIRVTNKLTSEEAASLSELANLYKAWNLPEQAVDYYRQAADIYTQLGDQRFEGFVRSNLADTLIKLDQLDEARPELLRAIECKQAFGHAAEPWKTWDILSNLERAADNPAEARKARERAFQAYLAYRRDGGENHSGAGRMVLDVSEAIRRGDTEEMEKAIDQLAQHENMQEHRAFLDALKAIMAGERDPTLAGDEAMYYQHAAELHLLLEQLSAQREPPEGNA